MEGRESSVLTRQSLLEGRGLGPDDRTEDFDVGDGLDGEGLLQFGVEAGVGLTDQVISPFFCRRPNAVTFQRRVITFPRNWGLSAAVYCSTKLLLVETLAGARF